MAPDRRSRVSDLYHAALARPARERGAFLKEACAGDEILRQEVESLLGYESAAAQFLETPAPDVIARAPGGAPGTPQMVGRQLGSYTILALLGAGGMGEVYRARDGKLGREVALKILPPHFTGDGERRARFTREAHVLATLNHPHIGAIYGLEEADGLTALVLELIEGPTLAELLARGRLPMSEAFAIARQIAEALEAAHEKGIVHRDLKPANIVLQNAANASGVSSGRGQVKVLDFGIAKTMGMGSEVLTQSASLGGTAVGRILGTPAYMSPEQARGLAVDKRTDIWAFGCVLFEMLAVRPAFAGDTMSDMLVAILEREPDWALLPAGIPASIRALLDRCLRKDPHNRQHDIADARIELDEGMKPVASGSVGTATARRWRDRLGWMMAASLAVALAWTGMALLNRRDVQPPPELVEFPIAPAENSRFTGTSPDFAISPDGREVAFVASVKGQPMLWVRSLGTLALRSLPGTERASRPFWSPDSRSLAFFAGTRLNKVQVNGGSPVVICEAPGQTAVGSSGTWGANEVIVFAMPNGELRRVSSRGGTSTPVTVLAKGDEAHRWPGFLPDGAHFLYLAQGGAKDELRVGSLNSADTISLGPFESHGVYAAGYLFFVRGGNLMAQTFDADTLQLKGAPVQLGAPTGVDPPWQRGMFSVSATGRLVYRPTARSKLQLTWLGRDGDPLKTVGDPGVIFNLDLSPNDQQVAVAQLTQQPGAPAEFDLWLMDAASGKATRLTDDPAWEFDPAWSRDGTQIAFNSNRPFHFGARFGLFMRASNVSGEDVPLVKAAAGINVTSPDWSRDGIIVYSNDASNSGTGYDLWTLSGDRTPTVFLQTKHDEAGGTFSPDGRWIAYHSNASDRNEVYVRPFPAKEPMQQISHDGGDAPRWRPDGKELFFRSADGSMMAAVMDTTKGLRAGVPSRLFATQLGGPGNYRPYAVARDGQRFLIPMPIPASPEPLRVVLDWRALLAK